MNTFLFLILFCLRSDTPNADTGVNTNVHTNLEILCDCDRNLSTIPSTGEGKFSELFGSKNKGSFSEMLDIQVHFYEINIQSYDRRFQWNISNSFYDLQSRLRSMAKYSPQHAWISVKFEIPPYGNLVRMANDQDYRRGIQSSAERHNWRILSGRPTVSDFKHDLNLHVWIKEFYNFYLF